MKLIVGLGNPGRRYENTRHNIGFDVVTELAARHGTGQLRTRFQADTVEAVVDDQRLLLLCPATYMNKSGASVQPARDFYKLTNDSLLIICDDFNLPLGKLRFRAKGSSGGQKGLQNIIQRLGSDQFARLRIGIGNPPEAWDVADYVLSRFRSDERQTIDAATQRAADAATDWWRHGVAYCMNRYNAD